MVDKFKFLLKYAYRFRWWYAGGIVFLGLTILVSVTVPEYIQKSIDLIGIDRATSEGLFYNYILIILGLALVLMIVRSMSRVLFFIPGRLIEKQLKGEMYQKLTSFGKDYYDENSSGSIISRINNDINGIRMITGFGLLQIFNILFSLSVTPYKMWKMSPSLTLYVIFPMLIIFMIVRYGIVFMVRNSHRRMEALQRLSGKTVSYLSGNSVIKSFNIHKWAEDGVHKENVSLFKYTMNITWIRSFIMPLLSGLEQVLKVVILFVGGMYVINNEFSIGQLTEYIAYTALLTQPIMGLGWVLTIFQQGFVGIDSLQTIINRKGAAGTAPGLAEKSGLFTNGLSLRNLNYTYHNGEEAVLKNISFDIRPGQIVGITGKVGCGKTTLINCINGYLRPGKGQLYFSGTDSVYIRNKDIRSVVRTVSQEVFLFSDTIENNIVFGSNTILDKERIAKVIFQSALKDEIERFPKKELTMVGEKGIMLSGGQKQRISLARALYSPIELLILDDVFSAVDTDTERFLIREIFDSNIASTILVVSNRISVLEKTDFIIVLENGEIKDQGSHDELIQNSEFYYDTWKLQEGK